MNHSTLTLTTSSTWLSIVLTNWQWLPTLERMPCSWYMSSGAWLTMLTWGPIMVSVATCLHRCPPSTNC